MKLHPSPQLKLIRGPTICNVMVVSRSRTMASQKTINAHYRHIYLVVEAGSEHEHLVRSFLTRYIFDLEDGCTKGNEFFVIAEYNISGQTLFIVCIIICLFWSAYKF